MRGSISIALRYAGTASSGRPAFDSASASPWCAPAFRGSISIALRYAGTASSGRPAFDSASASPR